VVLAWPCRNGLPANVNRVIVVETSSLVAAASHFSGFRFGVLASLSEGACAAARGDAQKRKVPQPDKESADLSFELLPHQSFTFAMPNGGLYVGELQESKRVAKNLEQPARIESNDGNADWQQTRGRFHNNQLGANFGLGNRPRTTPDGREDCDQLKRAQAACDRKYGGDDQLISIREIEKVL